MFTIAKLTRRYYYGDQPHEFHEYVENYYSDIEKARAAVKDILGEEATLDNEFGFDSWASIHHPKVVYFIDLIRVW